MITIKASLLLLISLLSGERLIPAKASTTIITPQPDLTQEEKSILEEIEMLQKLHGQVGGDDEYIGDKSIEGRLEVLQEQIDTEVERLEPHKNLVDQYTTRREIALKEFEELKNNTQRLFSKDIVGFNVKQMKKVYDRIVASKEEELERREMGPEIIISQDGVNDASEQIDEEEEEEEEEEEQDEEEEEEEKQQDVDDGTDIKKITKSDLEALISLQTLVEYSESTVFDAIDRTITEHMDSKIIPNQFTHTKEQMQQKVLDLEAEKDKLVSFLETSKNVDDQCVRTTETLNMVQNSIWKYSQDGGIHDHLSDGAVVVYGDEWTSVTYSVSSPPQSMVGEDNDDEEIMTLGDYEHYIPQDWARLFPNGWQDMDISYIYKFLEDPRQVVPTSFWYSFPLPLKKILSPYSYSSKSKPPETIMSNNNQLGSCWAMTGRNGKVTLRLNHPISIQSVTIDHYPGLPSAHDYIKESKEAINSSAPRSIRLVGYPPCRDEDEKSLDCMKLGFDKSQPIKLGSFEYKPVPSNPLRNDGIDDFESDVDHSARRSTQNFTLNPVESSCSVTKPTCESGLGGNDEIDVNETNQKQLPVVAAVSLVIDENWGNDKFTCIYRVRVHSE